MVTETNTQRFYNARTISLGAERASSAKTSENSDQSTADLPSLDHGPAYTLDITAEIAGIVAGKGQGQGIKDLPAEQQDSETADSPYSGYTLLNRLAEEGRLGELSSGYNLIDHLKANGTLIDLDSRTGILKFLNETADLKKSGFAF